MGDSEKQTLFFLARLQMANWLESEENMLESGKWNSKAANSKLSTIQYKQDLVSMLKHFERLLNIQELFLRILTVQRRIFPRDLFF